VAILLVACHRDRTRDNYLEGKGVAVKDIEKGERQIAFVDASISESNTPVAFWEYTEILRSRYRVGWVVYSLPDDPEAAKSWVRGYNEVARPKVEHQIAAQVLKDVSTEAGKSHSATQSNTNQLDWER